MIRWLKSLVSEHRIPLHEFRVGVLDDTSYGARLAEHLPYCMYSLLEGKETLEDVDRMLASEGLTDVRSGVIRVSVQVFGGLATLAGGHQSRMLVGIWVNAEGVALERKR